MLRNLTLVNGRQNDKQSQFEFCEPCLEDGAGIEKLIKKCHPLEENSGYVYLLLCKHFFKTCVVAKNAGQVIGFVSAYVKPEHSDTIFIWQVAVHRGWRKKGLALDMVRHLLARSHLRDVRYLEATVTTSNIASKKLFISIADAYGTQCKSGIEFSKDLFEDEAHEDEYLFRIGPIALMENDNEFDDVRSEGIPSTLLRPFFSNRVLKG